MPNIGKLGWAYVSGSTVAYTGQSDQFVTFYSGSGDSKHVSGSNRFKYDYEGDNLFLTGTLHISGAINAYEFKTIVHENTTYLGTTTFGNDDNDLHQFTGKISGSANATIVGNIYTDANLNVSGNALVAGNLTVGDGGEEDQKIILDGAETDYYLGLDDTDNIFKLGLGSTVGTNAALTIDTAGKTKFPIASGVSGSGPVTFMGAAVLGSTLNVSGSTTLAGNLTVGDGGAEDQKIVLDGNATDYYLGLDDTDDTFKLGLGSAVGTNAALTINTSGLTQFPIATGVSASGPATFMGATVLGSTLSVSGSTTLGDALADNHYVTGSVYCTGSLYVSGSGTGLTIQALNNQTTQLMHAQDGQDKFTIDSDGGIKFDSADGGFEFAQNSSAKFEIDINGVDDVIFKDKDGDEIFRIDESEDSLLMHGDSKLQFRDSGLYLSSSADGALDAVSDGSFNVTVGAAGMIIKGTTPKLTIGDGGAEDTALVLDGNATDYYLGLDDTDDTFKLGLGSAVGTNSALTINTSGIAKFPVGAGVQITGTLGVSGDTILGGNLTVGDGGAEDQKIVLDGNATDYYLGLDDTDDTFKLGLGSAVGTNAALTINTTGKAVFPLASGVQIGGNTGITGSLEVRNSAADATGALQDYFKQRGSGAAVDDDTVGKLTFTAQTGSAASELATVGSIRCDVIDVSTANGNIVFESVIGGTATEVARTNPESETANTFMGGFGNIRPIRVLSSGNMTLTAAMSGVDVVLLGGSAQTVTLPAKTTTGFVCRVIIASAQAHIIQSATGENVINGSIIDFNNTTGGTGLTAVGNQGRITLNNAAAGDILEFISTGTLWLLDGKLNDTPTLATT